MKNKILILLVSICVFQSNGQDLLKEITKTFENGKPMFIDYLEMEDLKKVKTEIFNESGTLIFSVQFNKDTGKYDGEFYDLINKGYFKDGVLNCNNCMLVEANKPSIYTYNHDRQNTLVTKGNVVNGRLTGKVERYTLREETYRKVDWESTRKYVDAGAGLGFRDVKTYTTGQFNKTQLKTFNYNSNGVLDGEQIFKYKNGEVRRAKLNFKNGIAQSKVTYDSNNLIIDSLFNENKIWKINKKFVKNDGFLMFSGLQENWTGDYSVEYHKSGFYNNPGNPQQDGQPWEKLILLGGTQKIGNYYDERPFDTGGVPSGLNDNGLYTIKINNYFNEIINWSFVKDYKDISLFYLLYNYIINEEYNLFETKFDANSFRYLPDLINSLKKANSDNSRFSKYLKKGFENVSHREEGSYLKIKDLFDRLMSYTDFIIACKEIIENKETEIQEIFVWNNIAKRYDKVNFSKFIDIVSNSQEKLNSKFNEMTQKLILMSGKEELEISKNKALAYDLPVAEEFSKSNNGISGKEYVTLNKKSNSDFIGLVGYIMRTNDNPSSSYNRIDKLKQKYQNYFKTFNRNGVANWSADPPSVLYEIKFSNYSDLMKFCQEKYLLNMNIGHIGGTINSANIPAEIFSFDLENFVLWIKPTVKLIKPSIEPLLDVKEFIEFTGRDEGMYDRNISEYTNFKGSLNSYLYSYYIEKMDIWSVNEKLSPQESYEEMKKRFEVKMELFEKEASYNSYETNEKRREELEADYKKLQNTQKKATQDSSNENVTSNSDTTNTDLISDNSTNERIRKPIENLELWYSSEKSSDVYLKQFSSQVKDLNSYYSLNLYKIEIHRVPGNEDASEAFTFYYFKDLNGLKKLEQLSSENKSVNLYYKDENTLLLVYNAKK